MITETIAAIATPSGRGGVGVVRVSGPKAFSIAKAILGFAPKVRYAHYTKFIAPDTQYIIDQGIALYFAHPHSFTGEDILELQAHGGPIVLDQLLTTCIQLGARLAKPGEFSEQAFLNNKIDLAQAEAIADLINAESTQAARSAMRSLQGEFSQQINQLVQQLIQLRLFVEAAIDFPEEEIDFIKDSHVINDLNILLADLATVLAKAQQGVLLQEGMHVVIIGAPNAGKSSLLNLLSGKDSAIVTDIAGTTRDVLTESIQIDGMPMHIIDTAGLRETTDVIEQEGVRRAHAALAKADAVLFVIDSTQPKATITQLLPSGLPTKLPILTIYNKIDLLTQLPENSTNTRNNNIANTIYVSVKQQLGIDKLKQQLKNLMGYQAQTSEGSFIARRRHLDALEQARQYMTQGLAQLQSYHAAELLAEELRLAQQALSSITGEFSADDLLGEIFSSFCIGK